MAKVIKLYYSSSRNISFHNQYSPDVYELPDDWDDMSDEAKLDLINMYEEEFVYELVEIYSEVVDDDSCVS